MNRLKLLALAAIIMLVGAALYMGWSGGLLPRKEEGGQALDLSRIRRFCVQYVNIKIDALAMTPCELIIIDYSAGGVEGRFKAEDINRLKHSPKGRKLVLAYLSVGEAEPYRWYWQSSWDADKDGRPDPGAPSWLAFSNPMWGSYRVRYWEPGWKEILIQYIDQILEADYDGIALDTVDVYVLFEQERPSAERDMVELISELVRYVREVRGKRDFIFITIGGEALHKYPEHLRNMNGILRENVWFFNGERLPAEQSEALLRDLRRWKEAGKLVLVIEYVDDQKADEVFELAKREGFVPYVTVLLLDRIVFNKFWRD